MKDEGLLWRCYQKKIITFDSLPEKLKLKILKDKSEKKQQANESSNQTRTDNHLRAEVE